jgi:hypothetical protein
MDVPARVRSNLPVQRRSITGTGTSTTSCPQSRRFSAQFFRPAFDQLDWTVGSNRVTRAMQRGFAEASRSDGKPEFGQVQRRSAERSLSVAPNACRDFPRLSPSTLMPDRISELVRQRALVSEHLAWLDREIAKAGAIVEPAASARATPATSGVSAASSEQLPEKPTLGVASSSAATTPPAGIPSETELLLDQYRVTPAAVKEDVRKGCLLYFIGAFVILGIIIAVLYFTIGTRDVVP